MPTPHTSKFKHTIIASITLVYVIISHIFIFIIVLQKYLQCLYILTNKVDVKKEKEK